MDETPETGSTPADDTALPSAGAGSQWEAPPGEWRVGGESGSTWVAQLQAMIDNIAEQAGPTVREIAAKAAELAAVAAEHAGPLAQRAANVTTEVGQKVAARSKGVAADLRRSGPGRGPKQGSGPRPDETP